MCACTYCVIWFFFLACILAKVKRETHPTPVIYPHLTLTLILIISKNKHKTENRVFWKWKLFFSHHLPFIRLSIISFLFSICSPLVYFFRHFSSNSSSLLFFFGCVCSICTFLPPCKSHKHRYICSQLHSHSKPKMRNNCIRYSDHIQLQWKGET